LNQLRRLRAFLRSIGGGPGYNGPPSDHFDGHHFFNPEAPAGRSFGDFLRWQRTAQRKPWPVWVERKGKNGAGLELLDVSSRS